MTMGLTGQAPRFVRQKELQISGTGSGPTASRPVFTEKPGATEDPETARIRSALLAGVSAETPEGQARALLANLLDWHRREDKPAW